MAYSIHIERYDEAGRQTPIDAREWAEAVNATNNVRLADSDMNYANPVTGENVAIENDGENAELYDEQQTEWLPVFRWTKRGSISFNARPDFQEATSRFRMVASELACKLGARLVGDEGESYL